MDLEQQVAGHYGRSDLEAAILEALRVSGKNVDGLRASDLSGADEFHLGWHQATVALARDLMLGPGMRVLDLGSGIGGPARYMGEAHHCDVTGVDLTPEYVSTANALTRRCGLGDHVRFEQASALSLPFQAGAFARVTLIHVGMNIAEKARLFSEARRVLEAGGLFGVYDIVRTGDGALPYPMPWAQTEETSFVEPLGTYRSLLEAAGFAIESETDRSAMCLELAARMREQAEAEGPPPMGLHLLMGPATRERLANVMAALRDDLLSPVQIIARAH